MTIAKNHEYTGETFTAPSGSEIVAGMEFTLKVWGVVTGRRSGTISSTMNRLVKAGISKQEAFNSSINVVVSLSDTNNEFVHTYHGDGFTTYLGVEVKDGDSHRLGTWITMIGITKAVYLGHKRNTVTIGAKDSFSAAISVPVRKRGEAASAAVPLTREHKQRAESAHKERSSWIARRLKTGVAMAKILDCKTMYPELSCMPCKLKPTCFGEARA